MSALDLKFDREEDAANFHLMEFMEWMRRWELNCNDGEMIHAIHTLQLFIIKHMLQRLGAEGFSDWYGSQEQSNST